MFGKKKNFKLGQNSMLLVGAPICFLKNFKIWFAYERSKIKIKVYFLANNQLAEHIF
jgi:hypothetical protein